MLIFVTIRLLCGLIKMIQQMLNRMCTEKRILKRQLNNQKLITFFACFGLAAYISIDRNTLCPLILLLGLYVFFMIKGRYL